MASNKLGNVPNLPVYDEFELKSLIKKAKLRKQELQAESFTIAGQLEEIQTKYENYKIGRRAVEIDEEIKQLELDDCSVVFDKKFLEADKKLTLQIINCDIKISLPKLEQVALSWELKMHGFEKQVQKSEKEIACLPSGLLKSREELLVDLSELRNDKSRLIGIYFVTFQIRHYWYCLLRCC